MTAFTTNERRYNRAITTNQIKRQFPHHVAIAAVAVRGESHLPKYQLVKELAGAPRAYRMQCDGKVLVVFCFGTRGAAEIFAARFKGDIITA